ncbi:hypothetical protein ABIE52_001333 [Rhodococcus sp. OAS809]|uniref:hypothetical protein n=1 Tax=Rhodococcus sp. OAS809 TaxID=2663874 RepID=UPI0019FBC570
MAQRVNIAVGVKLSENIDEQSDYGKRPFRARVRWTELAKKKRPNLTEPFETQAWIDRMRRLAMQGIDPKTTTMSLADYGKANMELVLRGLEKKTTDPRQWIANARCAVVGTHPDRDDHQWRDRPCGGRLDQ